MNATGRLLRPDEVLSLHLPSRSTGDKTTTWRPPKVCPFVEPQHSSCCPEVDSSTETEAADVSMDGECNNNQTEGLTIVELQRLLLVQTANCFN